MAKIDSDEIRFLWWEKQSNNGYRKAFQFVDSLLTPPSVAWEKLVENSWRVYTKAPNLHEDGDS